MIYQKLQKCRDSIKNIKLEKKGWNDYSKYKYYLPEQVDELVYVACKEQNIFTKFDLLRNEFGLYGQLTIINLEKPDDNISFYAATEMPAIKATNASQQMGGAMTFVNRYLLMFAFDIVENSLDFDSQKPDKKISEKEIDLLSLDQVTEIQDEIERRQGIDVPKMLQWCSKAWGYPVNEIADIRQKNYKALLTMITKKPLIHHKLDDIVDITDR